MLGMLGDAGEAALQDKRVLKKTMKALGLGVVADEVEGKKVVLAIWDDASTAELIKSQHPEDLRPFGHDCGVVVARNPGSIVLHKMLVTRASRFSRVRRVLKSLRSARRPGDDSKAVSSVQATTFPSYIAPSL